MHRALIVYSLLVASGAAVADEAAAPRTAAVVSAMKPAKASAPAAKSPEASKKADAAEKPKGDVQMSGMSVLGNDDAPKSLALVPWKSSLLGDALSLSKLLDDSTQPVDKEVFMRELSYYQIKTDSPVH
jgi:hypothetical protein